MDENMVEPIKAGDVINLTNELAFAGYCTSSGTALIWTIYLSRPIEATSVTFTADKCNARQNGLQPDYVIGSSNGGEPLPAAVSTAIEPNVGVRCMMFCDSMPNNKMTNNDTIAFTFFGAKLTFS